MLSARLKELRESKGWSLSEAGEKLGLPKSTYAHYEAGRRDVPNELIPHITDLYGVSSDYLHGLTDDPVPKAGRDGWQDIRDVVKNAELAMQFRILGADIIKLNAELLRRGMTKEELETLLKAVLDIKK